MSFPLLTAAILDLALLLVFSTQIRARYRSSLTSVEEKSAGILYFYRNALSAVFRGNMAPGGLQILAHYVALHLAVPLVGLGLFLRTDANFLAVIGAMIASMQLYQRVFPGQSRRPLTDSQDPS